MNDEMVGTESGAQEGEIALPAAGDGVVGEGEDRDVWGRHAFEPVQIGGNPGYGANGSGQSPLPA